MDMSGITLIPPEDRNGLAGVLILTLLVAFSCLVVGSMQAQVPQVTCGCLKSSELFACASHSRTCLVERL